eukprot:CAMPEP_0182858532 /NCGR_PEP_ID=MMETSP0034_2-20130328/3733_1 /TAXON_ID=156128 /ORGANISM="Nephroselmis pyriformis, Strain CCMP717" /LENGTH=120 /DNA_ID=CAMNT_0024989973 /DNA_START=157 /DNA_END=515 /DNA_ORIENTATION=-
MTVVTGRIERRHARIDTRARDVLVDTRPQQPPRPLLVPSRRSIHDAPEAASRAPSPRGLPGSARTAHHRSVGGVSRGRSVGPPSAGPGARENEEVGEGRVCRVCNACYGLPRVVSAPDGG